MERRFVRTEYDDEDSRMVKIPCQDPYVFGMMSMLAQFDLEIISTDYQIDQANKTVTFTFLVDSVISTKGGPVE